MLDGEHHTDELGAKFEVGWPVIEGWLRVVGGVSAGGIGEGEGFGRVVIIYR
jgi:nitrogen permease regulator 2-like protein